MEHRYHQESTPVLSPNTHDLYRMTLPGKPAVSRTGMQNQKDAFSDKSNSGYQHSTDQTLENLNHQPSTINLQSEDRNQTSSINNQQSTISNLPSQIPGPDRRADRTRAGRNPQPEFSAEADGQTPNLDAH